MKITIVILHYGELSVTQKCVESLFERENYPFSLLIVNNMSDPLTKKDFPQKHTTIINNKNNLGFAGGVNVGIRYALSQKADAILLLNNDTIITRPMLPTLVKTLQKEKRVGIVAPVIEFKKKGQTLFDLGGHVIMPFGRTYHTEVATPSASPVKNIEYVSGCCMLIKREVFEKTGLFDERFFLYYEDVDFCLRAKQKGFLVDVASSVNIYHELSKSAGKLSALSVYHQLRSALLFGKKYNHGIFRTPNILFIFIQTVLFFKANPKQTLEALSAWKFAF